MLIIGTIQSTRVQATIVEMVFVTKVKILFGVQIVDDMIQMKKTITILFFLCFFFIATLAQEARIKLEHVGFGETTKEAYFTIYNVGSIPVTDVTIYLDGNKWQTIQGKSSPGRGFEVALYLTPGDHLIEARTPEGAYDSFKIKISGTEESMLLTTKEKAKSFLEQNIIWIALVIILIIIIIIWLLLRKPKLEV